MKPPVVNKVKGNARGLASPPAVSVSPSAMKNRADFLKTATGSKSHCPGFVLQARDRHDTDPVVRVGFTCSKKVGNAVARNRAKRRLREVARKVLPQTAPPGWDFVLVGRADVTASRDFDVLADELTSAVQKLTKTAT